MLENPDATRSAASEPERLYEFTKSVRGLRSVFLPRCKIFKDKSLKINAL